MTALNKINDVLPTPAGRRVGASGPRTLERLLTRLGARTSTQRRRSERLGASPLVCCPVCGRPASLPEIWSTVDRCPHCHTPLMVSSRSLDVEQTVRGRLYGTSPDRERD